MTQFRGRGTIQLTGRNMGKSQVVDLLKHYYNNMTMVKIKWQQLPGNKLRAYVDEVAPRGFERGLRESDMDPIQAWCVEHQCGRRMSFNEFQFRTSAEISMFMLRWA